MFLLEILNFLISFVSFVLQVATWLALNTIFITFSLPQNMLVYSVWSKFLMTFSARLSQYNTYSALAEICDKTLLLVSVYELRLWSQVTFELYLHHLVFDLRFCISFLIHAVGIIMVCLLGNHVSFCVIMFTIIGIWQACCKHVTYIGFIIIFILSAQVNDT